MRCSSRPISPLVGFTNRSNPLPSLRVPLPYLLKLDRALREFVSPSIDIYSEPGHSDFKLVVIIDDSDSVSKTTCCDRPSEVVFLPLKMEGGLWLQARDALAGVAEFSRQKGGESIDIYCLNNPRYRLDLRVGHISYSSRSPDLLVDRANWTSAISSTVFPQKVIPLYLLAALYSHQVRSNASRRQTKADSGYLYSED